MGFWLRNVDKYCVMPGGATAFEWSDLLMELVGDWSVAGRALQATPHDYLMNGSRFTV